MKIRTLFFLFIILTPYFERFVVQRMGSTPN